MTSITASRQAILGAGHLKDTKRYGHNEGPIDEDRKASGRTIPCRFAASIEVLDEPCQR